MAEPDYPKQFYEADSAKSAGFMQPYKLGSGNTRGTQTVGFGGAKIDGANNRIIITNPADGSQVGIGVIPGTTTNEFGFFSLDSDGNVIMKIVNGTKYTYNPLDSFHNVMQDGILPDGSGGWAVAASGKDVSEGIS